MKILFLTTLSLASNPRLVKEIQLAVDHHCRVEVICFLFRNDSKSINEKMLQRFSSQGVRFHCIEAGKETGFDWLASVFAEKYYRFISGTGTLKARALASAVSRRSKLLLQSLKKIEQADWVIGHNPGALFATQWAAKKLQAKAGFDVEDYHPGEGDNKKLQQLTRQLMQEVLPTMNYVSFAAPLIREAVKKDLGKEGANWVTILNYFPSEEFKAPVTIDGPLQLVWYSQHIAADRGLEYILPVLNKYAANTELHLFGKLDHAFYESHLKHMGNVVIHPILPQEELHRSLSSFDVGLALEPGKDLNNDLAISNKLLAYVQAGLFVLASNTSAQQAYLGDYADSSFVFNLKNAGEVEAAFLKVIRDRDKIRVGRLERFQHTSNNNWESESTGIINSLT